MVIKHHLFTNFSLHGIPEPTWVNVAREPVSRFISSYYFRRYGFNRHEGVRNKKVKKGERQIDMVIKKWSLLFQGKESISPNLILLAEIDLTFYLFSEFGSSCRNWSYSPKLAWFVKFGLLDKNCETKNNFHFSMWRIEMEIYLTE